MLTEEMKRFVAEQALNTTLKPEDLMVMLFGYFEDFYATNEVEIEEAADEYGVHRCHTCNVWCNKCTMLNDTCNKCYIKDHDE
jgi:hypothetical protein